MAVHVSDDDAVTFQSNKSCIPTIESQRERVQAGTRAKNAASFNDISSCNDGQRGKLGVCCQDENGFDEAFLEERVALCLPRIEDQDAVRHEVQKWKCRYRKIGLIQTEINDDDTFRRRWGFHGKFKCPGVKDRDSSKMDPKTKKAEKQVLIDKELAKKCELDIRSNQYEFNHEWMEDLAIMLANKSSETDRTYDNTATLIDDIPSDLSRVWDQFMERHPNAKKAMEGWFGGDEKDETNENTQKITIDGKEVEVPVKPFQVSGPKGADFSFYSPGAAPRALSSQALKAPKVVVRTDQNKFTNRKNGKKIDLWTTETVEKFIVDLINHEEALSKAQMCNGEGHVQARLAWYRWAAKQEHFPPWLCDDDKPPPCVISSGGTVPPNDNRKTIIKKIDESIIKKYGPKYSLHQLLVNIERVEVGFEEDVILRDEKHCEDKKKGEPSIREGPGCRHGVCPEGLPPPATIGEINEKITNKFGI